MLRLSEITPAPTRVRASRTWLLAALLIALLASSCAGGGFEPAALADTSPTPPSTTEASRATASQSTSATQAVAGNYQPTIEPVDVPALGLTSADLVDGQLTSGQVELVASWFDAFLSARDLLYVGRVSVDDLGEFIEDRRSLDRSQALAAEYVRLLSEDAVIAKTEFASFSNISNVSATRGRITFDDCTEQQSLSTLGIVGFRWITHRATLSEVDGQWRIAQLEVVHDGEPWTEAYGCAPASFQDRAVVLASQFMEEQRTYQQNPGALPNDAFPYIADDFARQTFVDAITRQQEEGLAVISAEQFRYDVLGLDVAASLIDWVVVVEACSYRPDGLAYTINGSEQATQDPDVPQGFSLSYRFEMSLEPVTVGIQGVDKITKVDIGTTDCWQRNRAMADQEGSG